MTDRHPDATMLIGLHKLAAQNGDGLVPELHELLMAQERRRQAYPNVMEFPLPIARRPGDAIADTARPAGEVVAFRSQAAQKASRKTPG